MTFNYSKLLGLMREKGETQQSLADKLDINIATLNTRLKNNSEFKQIEMYKICKILGIDNPTEYFFCVQTL